MAKQGAGFVTVYCTDSEQAHAAAALLREFSPESMRRYRSFAIEDLLQSGYPGLTIWQPTRHTRNPVVYIILFNIY